MTGRYTEYDNVVDFVEYKLTRLIDELAKLQRIDIAEQISDALDAYLCGSVDVHFVDGWPYVTYAKQSEAEDLTEWHNYAKLLSVAITYSYSVDNMHMCGVV